MHWGHGFRTYTNESTIWTSGLIFGHRGRSISNGDKKEKQKLHGLWPIHDVSLRTSDKCFTTAVAAVVQVSVGDWKQTLTLRVELEHFLVKVKWMHSLAMWMLGTYPLTGLHMFVAFVQGTHSMY